MTLRDASKELGVKVRTLRQWIDDGKIKANKYGKYLDISRTEVEKKKRELYEKRKRRICKKPGEEIEKIMPVYFTGRYAKPNKKLLKKHVNDLMNITQNKSGVDISENVNLLMYSITREAIALVVSGEIDKYDY